MITSAEAAGKWCPLVRQLRQLLGEPGTYNDASPRNRGEAGCIASRCMMWRESAQKNAAGEALGYCGLAGRPSPRD